MSELRDWFSLPTVKIGHQETAADIRAWEPGDGLACRGSKQAKRIPCGAPVALVRSVTRDPAGYRNTRTVHSVYCERHVVEIVRRQLGDANWLGVASTQDTIRQAEETVLAAHWDEYQEAVRTILAQQRDKYLGQLPEWLREQMATAEEMTS